MLSVLFVMQYEPVASLSIDYITALLRTETDSETVYL